MSENHRRQRCTPADIDGQRQYIQDNLRGLRVGRLAAVNLRLPVAGALSASDRSTAPRYAATDVKPTTSGMRNSPHVSGLSRLTSARELAQEAGMAD